MKNKKKNFFLIIASVAIFTMTVGAFARQDQVIFARIATVLVCAIKEPAPDSYESLPETRCATNEGNSIMIIHERLTETLRDTVIATP